jgi:hypothetical protein
MKEPRISPCIAVALFLILLVAFAQGQVPQGIPYQAIARNGQGQPLANLPVNVRFSVLDSTASGPVVYSETHEPITSALGLFSVNVGMGNSTIGSFSSINWGMNAKFLKVELDTTASGSNYIDLGTQQMMSVPYALYAGSTFDQTQSSNTSQVSDSTLELFWAGSIMPNTYNIPIDEFWKVVSFYTLPGFGNINWTGWRNGYCSYYAGAYHCSYTFDSMPIFIMDGTFYYANLNSAGFEAGISLSPGCIDCPSTAQAPVGFAFTFPLPLPLWLSPAQSITLNNQFSRLVVEKYK